MAIVNKEFLPNASLMELINESKRQNADVIQSISVTKGKPDGAVIVISGPDTKAYLQALKRADELIEEDRDDIPY